MEVAIATGGDSQILERIVAQKREISHKLENSSGYFCFKAYAFQIKESA
jgi:hypothetical protein